jgi:uncharacterized protein (TIGR02186 family)
MRRMLSSPSIASRPDAPLPARLLACLVTACLVLAMTAIPAFAQTETIQADTSDREIAIESDFTGAKITVFGAVDNGRQPAANSGYYDVVMVIRGPSETLVAREKERFAGIWVNGNSASFAHVPSFYAALSTRPLDEIAEDGVLRRQGIEFNPKARDDGQTPPPDRFETAIIEAKKKDRLYIVDPFAVAFISKSLFRGTVTLPTKVKVGNYSAEVYLFRAGALLSQHNTSLKVHKAGIERELTRLAYDRPWVYGLLSVLLAVVCGLSGWVLFSRS